MENKIDNKSIEFKNQKIQKTISFKEKSSF